MNIMHVATSLQTLLRISLLAVFGLIILFSQSRSASAQWTTNGNNINNTNSGNVGVGTTAPSERLTTVVNDAVNNGITHVLTVGHDTSGTPAAGMGSSLMFKSRRSDGLLTSTGYIAGVWENPTALTEDGALVFATVLDSTGFGTERMRLTSTGNLGIGTNAPGNLLQLNSGATPANTQFRITSNGLGSLALLNYAADNIQVGFDQDWSGSAMIARNTSAARIIKNAGKLTFSGNTGLTVGSGFTPTDRLSIDLGNGNIGIGTTAPTTKLNISSGTDASTSLLRLETAVHGGTNFAIGGTANNESFMDMSVYRSGQYFSRLGVNNWGQLYLQPSDSNVGIGTTTPDSNYKLDVVGNVRVSGNIAAKYQDVAEWVPAARALEPGTVVTLNPTQSNLVEASSKAYDTRVAGVISQQPGITLGERSENKVLVATTGRVRIKVDATNAPIAIGDLLVTSEKEGVAMKSVPLNMGGVEIHRPGTIVGKALEPLAKGQGEILVLLSLQ